MTPRDRICVLSFDEISISQELCFDKGKEQVIGPHKKAQVAFVRGLFDSWKQLFYYDYDQRMSTNLIKSLIKTMHNLGLKVVAAVCDGGSENQFVIRELGNIPSKPYYTIEGTDEKIFIFWDAPHLLKCLQNHLIDTGYAVRGKSVSKRPLVKLLQFLKTEKAKTEEEHIKMMEDRSKEALKATKRKDEEQADKAEGINFEMHESHLAYLPGGDPHADPLGPPFSALGGDEDTALRKKEKNRSERISRLLSS